MSTSAERFDERARREAARHGRTVIHRGELLRYPVYTRVLHWSVAIFFVLSLLTGFAVYSPWLFRWLTPLFNGGQKLYFWLIVVSAVLFLVTGLLMWFDDAVPRWSVAVSYVVHDIAALVMLAGFIIHVYEGTAAQPGTFRSMTDGTVSEEWAWTHHPAWYRDVTGRDPREDYERARRRQEERTRAVEAREREQDSRERAGGDARAAEFPER